MPTGLMSHFKAGTGAVCVTTGEYKRLRKVILAEVDAEAAANDEPPVEVAYTVSGISMPLRDARTGLEIDKTAPSLNGAYEWARSRQRRIAIVSDWHTMCNSVGSWTTLLEQLDLLRSPQNVCECGETVEVPEGQDSAECSCGETVKAHPSLIVFVAPTWDFQPINPLDGAVPIVPLAPPDRDGIQAILTTLRPLNGNKDEIIDSLCGLRADAVEQVAAEVLARNKGDYNIPMLSERKADEMRRVGLEIWKPEFEVGGMSGIQTFLTEEAKPWLRDPQLAVRRMLHAGVFGMGKSYLAKYYGGMIGAIVTCCSIPKLKASGGGIVGQAEGALEKVLFTVDAIAKNAHVILVFDEIDTISREGNDGGTSSGIFQMLLTWFQESKSLVTAWATLNRLDKLDPALASRFQAQFFYDLGTTPERESVALIHYKRLGCQGAESAAKWTADISAGFSSREIAEQICTSVARLSSRKPTNDVIKYVVKGKDGTGGMVPVSKTKEEEMTKMYKAAMALRRANNPEEASAAPAKSRRVAV